MSVLVDINGRQAVPIRAVSFVTLWHLSPDLVADGLERTGHWPERLKNLSAFHITPDGSIGEMLPEEWHPIAKSLRVLSAKLKEKETIPGESYSEWRHQSILLLPSHCFVWKDDLELGLQDTQRFSQHRNKLKSNYTPLIPTDLFDAVMEGMPPTRIKDSVALEQRSQTAGHEYRQVVTGPSSSGEGSPASAALPPWLQHQTKLLQLIPKVIAMGQASMESTSHWPKQEAFVANLVEKFGLSDKEARALDTLTRPDQLRKKTTLRVKI